MRLEVNHDHLLIEAENQPDQVYLEWLGFRDEQSARAFGFDIHCTRAPQGSGSQRNLPMRQLQIRKAPWQHGIPSEPRPDPARSAQEVRERMAEGVRRHWAGYDRDRTVECLKERLDEAIAQGIAEAHKAEAAEGQLRELHERTSRAVARAIRAEGKLEVGKRQVEEATEDAWTWRTRARAAEETIYSALKALHQIQSQMRKAALVEGRFAMVEWAVKLEPVATMLRIAARSFMTIREQIMGGDCLKEPT